MLDNLAMGIGWLVLLVGGLYVFYLIARSVPAMCRAWGFRGMLMMGIFFSGWGCTLYAFAHSDQYSTLVVMLPAFVTTAIYLGWLASLKAKATP